MRGPVDYTSLSGIDEDLKKIAIQRSKMLGISILDFSDELRSKVASNQPIKLNWFAPEVYRNYHSFLPRSEHLATEEEKKSILRLIPRYER